MKCCPSDSSFASHEQKREEAVILVRRMHTCSLERCKLLSMPWDRADTQKQDHARGMSAIFGRERIWLAVKSDLTAQCG